MIKIKFNNSNDYLSCSFSKSGNIVTLKGIQTENVTGFKTYRESDLRYLGDFSEFKTVYRVLDDGIQFSNNGTKYVEPKKEVVVSAIFNGVDEQAIEVTVLVNGEELEVVELNSENEFLKTYTNVPIADNYSITCDTEIEDTIKSVYGTTVEFSSIPEPVPYKPTIEERLEKVEPHVESKIAYIGETEVEFDTLKNKIVYANVVKENGETIPSTLEFTNDKIIVRFDAIDEIATVTIYEQ